MQVSCPSCNRLFEITTPGFTGSVSCPYCGQPVNVASDAEVVDYAAARPPQKKVFQVFGKLGVIFGLITFPISICGVIPYFGIVVFWSLVYFPLPVAGLVFSIMAKEKKGIIFNSIAIGLSLLALPTYHFWDAVIRG